MSSSRNDWSNRYGEEDREGRSRRGEYAEDRPGYSTANDFSEQQSPFGRSRRSGRDYRGYDQEDFPQYRERYKRSEYPETYRSAMSGYMSEHVGTDSGRRDYNRNTNEGNLYGTRYGLEQRDYQRGQEGDYDRGGPGFRERTGYRSTADRSLMEDGKHRGKGPRNYKRTDDRIQEDINDRLTDDPFVDASDVDVSVKSCEVILTGTVDSRGAKRRAEDIAESVSGVMHIENRIKVRSGENAEQPLPVTPY